MKALETPGFRMGLFLVEDSGFQGNVFLKVLHYGYTGTVEIPPKPYSKHQDPHYRTLIETLIAEAL